VSRIAVLLTVLTLAATSAIAGDPSTPPERPRGTMPPETLQIIDLAREIPGMGGRTIRMRRLTLAPGGALPLHGHADRPEIVYVLEGRVRDHRPGSPAADYGAGESMKAEAGLEHWIENIGDGPLVGLSIDIVNDGSAPAMTVEEIRRAHGHD
jgi:quercetin dioxygenase-like cupin family protein